jgi:glycosyltransferase involved in cell wall biosynthesis
MSVSVVMPTRNRCALLQRSLEALGRQRDCGAFELVVVDDGSTDATAQTLSAVRLPAAVQLRSLRQEHAGPAAARNRGLLACRGDVVAFTDDDCIVADDWVAQVEAAFTNGDATGFGGRLVSLPATTLVGRYLDWSAPLEMPPAAAGEVSYVNTANCAFTRSALLCIGGFDESFLRPGGEEVDLCRRLRAAGFSLAAAPAMVVSYAYRENLAALLATYFNYGRGQRTGTRRARAQGVQPSRRAPTPQGWWQRVGARWSRPACAPVGMARRAAYLALDVLRDGAYHLGYCGEWLAEGRVDSGSRLTRTAPGGNP